MSKNYNKLAKELQKEVGAPLTELLQKSGIKINDPIEMIDRNKLGAYPYPEFKDDEKLRKIAGAYNNITNYLFEFPLSMQAKKWGCNIGSEDGPIRQLPIKEGYMSKIDNYLFNELKKHLEKTNTLYRGLHFETKDDMNNCVHSIKDSGLCPRKGLSTMPVTLIEEVAQSYAGGNNGIVLEIDPSKIELKPVNYFTGGSNDLDKDYVFFRTEAQLRTPQIPSAAINKIIPIGQGIY